MIRKYPASILVALYAAAILTVVVLILLLLFNDNQKSLGLQVMGFFVISLVIITLIIELFVYKKLKILTQKSEKEIKKLQDLETYRREFIGDVSHELKTPIFAIEGFIETLLNGALEDKKVNRKFLQKALKHSERLSNLVQDILLITQIESGELNMISKPFSIFRLIDETVESLDTKFTKKGRNISCIINANGLELAEVSADENRIQQVLYNLIDNAVKYGDSQGTVVVDLEDKGTKIIVKVIDNGQGIEKEHIKRLFERFYRVDKSRSRNYGGTGLGLAICKHFIEAHKERIWVESEIGKGSIFQFSLAKSV